MRLKRKNSGLLLIGLFISIAPVILPSLVYAAATWNLVLNRSTTTPVDSGTNIVYELQIQCSAVAEPSCNDGQIVLDIPDDLLGILDLTVQEPNPLISAVTPTATGATIDLLNPFPAGASGSILFEVTTPNGITPDGYSWTVDATISGSNTGPDITAQSDGEAQATAELGVMKAGPLGFGDGQVVALAVSPDVTTVRYYILPCELNTGDTGDLWFESLTITDTLPADAVFVAASSGGVHDGSATGGDVTWNVSGSTLADDLCNANANYSASPYWVEVEYPTATNTTIVTNQVLVEGTPIGSTGTVTATDDLTHTFDEPSVDGSILKSGYTQLDYRVGLDGYIYAGSESGSNTVAWYVNVKNDGTVPMSFEVIEPVPCLDEIVSVGPPPIYDSKPPGDTCLRPAFVVNSVAVVGTTTAYANGWRPEYTTHLGTTGVFVKTGTNKYEPVGLPAGELIAEIRLPATPDITVPAGGQSGRFTIGGYVVANDHNGDPMPADTQVRNTATVNIPVDGTSDTATNRVIIIEPEIRGNLTKGMSGSGDTRTVQLSFTNKSATAQPVVVTDLLPAGISFIDVVKACVGSCTGLDSDTFTWEVLPNYNGTGRELVRLTSNTGYDIASLSSAKFDFTVSVAGLSPGTHTNDAQGFTEDPLDYCEGAATWIPEWFPPSTTDTFDLDGDGDFTDTYCQKSANINITDATAFLSSNKQVKGSTDPAFVGFPNVGVIIDPDYDAQYQLTFSNDGTAPLTNFIVYDILPHVGDTGVSGSQSGTRRESEFSVQLTDTISDIGLPAGTVIEYSALTNPCRPEVGGPVCDPPPPPPGNNDWTPDPNNLGGIANVRAFRITIPILALGETAVVTASVTAVDVVPNPGAIAWNSFAVHADGLPTTEPPKVGLGLELSDISLEKNISPAIVAPGEEFNISITVYHDALIKNNLDENGDPDGSVSYVDRITGLPTNAVFPATNVVVGEILPLGMTIVPGSSPATYNESTNEWTVGDIYPGQSFTLNLTATAGAAGSYTNVAEVTANDTPDIDSFPADDDGDQSGDDEDNADVVAEEPAIDIQKLVESSRDSGGFIEADASDGQTGDYIVGQPIRYRFVVTNPTGLPLTNVVVSDPLIAGFCTPATLTIATLAPGASQTIDCEYPLGFSDTVNPTVNTATVNAEYNDAAIPPDSDTAQIQVTPQLWDLSDAPNSYQTDVTTGGPMHLLNDSTLFLGTQIPDDDINGMPTAGADGDDLNSTSDEDGVTFRAVKSIFADVVVTNNTGGPVTVCAWLDVPSGGVVDGVFDASDGQCQTTSAVNPTLTFEWTGMPIDKAYTTYARFRVTSDMTMAATDPAGAFADGEVEDYQVDFDFSPTAVTINKVLLNGMSVGEVLAGMGVSLDDTAEALSLLAGWDPDLADSLGAADSETLLAALRDYLDPDGDGRVAVLQWETTAERGTIGFYVERNDDGGQGAWHRINDDMLPGLITAPMGGYYWLADPEARSGVNYLYRMIEQEARGRQNTYGPYPLRLQ